MLTHIMNNKVNVDIKTLIHFFIEEYFNIPVEEYVKGTEDSEKTNYLFWSSPYLDVNTVKKAIFDEILIPKSVWENINIELENLNNHLNNFDSDNDTDYINTIEENNHITLSEEQKHDYFKLGEQAGFDVNGEFYYSIREQVSELENALIRNANKSVRKRVMRYYNKKRFNGIPFNNWVLIFSIKNELEAFIDDYIERIEVESGVPIKYPIKFKAYHNENIKVPLENESNTDNTFPNDLFNKETDEYFNELEIQSRDISSLEENIKLPEDEFKIHTDVEVTKFDEENENDIIENKNINEDKSILEEDRGEKEPDDIETSKTKNNTNKEETSDNHDKTDEEIAVFDMYGIRDENKDTSVLEDVFFKKGNSD